MLSSLFNNRKYVLGQLVCFLVYPRGSLILKFPSSSHATGNLRREEEKEEKRQGGAGGRSSNKRREQAQL